MRKVIHTRGDISAFVFDTDTNDFEVYNGEESSDEDLLSETGSVLIQTRLSEDERKELIISLGGIPG